jgi:hypothetical protein
MKTGELSRWTCFSSKRRGQIPLKITMTFVSTVGLCVPTMEPWFPLLHNNEHGHADWHFLGKTQEIYGQAHNVFFAHARA